MAIMIFSVATFSPFFFGLFSTIPPLLEAEKVVPVLISPIIVGDNRLFGYGTSQPAFDAALDRARQLYPRVFQDYIYLPFYFPGVYPTCPESAAAMLVLFSELYNTTRRIHEEQDPERKIFIISPGCSDEILQLGDICRELDISLIASTAADPALSNNERFPTLLVNGPSQQLTIAQTILTLLTRYSWESASLISDLMTSDATIAPIMVLYDRTIRQTISNPSSGVNVLAQSIDSTKTMNFDGVLKVAASHSSIFVLVSFAAEVYLAILTRAMDFHMDTGKCVFFIVQFGELPLYHGSLLQRENLLKEHADPILPFVFEIASSTFNITAAGDAEWDRIANVSVKNYSRVLEPNYKFSNIVMSAYDSIIILAQVINETYNRLDEMTGADFINHFRNRTFDRHTFSKLRITENRRRSELAFVRVYHKEEHNFRETWVKRSGENLKLIDNDLISWVQQWKGQSFPPAAMPSCRMGILDGDVDCSLPDLSAYNHFAFILVPVLFFGAWTMLKIRKKFIVQDNEWWNVSFADVDFDGPAKTGKPPYRLTITGLAVNMITLDGRQVDLQCALYKGQPILVVKFAWEMKFADIARDRKTLAILHHVKNLDHQNIARFYGLSFDHGHKTGLRQMLILTESPKKGLLRDLIDSDKLAFQWGLRASLMWDILRGLKYIHASPLKYHGCLAFMNLIIDEHFTLKIALTGSVHHYNATKIDPMQRYPVPRIANLWMAPEVVDQVDTRDKSEMIPEPTSAADIFSVGVIMYEIASRNPPFDVDITDISDIKAMIHQIRSGQLDVEAYPLPPGVPPEMAVQIKKCWSFSPTQRPTISKLSRTMIHLHPGSNISVAEGILRRLEQYNQELEATVLARRDALVLEQAKVDALLSNVLPKSIVQDLRNGLFPMPDYFSSVTVLFSDVPAFNLMVAVSTPFSIVDFLHRLYSKMDEAIDKHDVYKVETIKDSYMVASGLPVRNEDRHAVEIAKVALMFLETSAVISSPADYQAKCPFIKLRIGINSGPCVAAVIGVKQPRYCLVGDTVNTASRMETHGEASKIHISSSMKTLLDSTNLFEIEERGIVSIKGKSDVLTYWLKYLIPLPHSGNAMDGLF